MPRTTRILSLLGAVLLAGSLLVGCSTEPDETAPEIELEDSDTRATPAPTDRPSDPPTADPTADPGTGEQALASDGRPRRATLTIPKLGLRDLAVVPYVGWTDDAPGTDIQNRGNAATPHGPRGGVGPGGVGNYQVTAHRLSSTRAFEFLPRLHRGDEVYVDAGAKRYVYRISTTRETSFRSPESLREQRAAVPGRPGVEPTRAMITLSTCSTIEDHAAGNWWADRFGNPEHRIDKIGVLVRIEPA